MGQAASMGKTNHCQTRFRVAKYLWVALAILLLAGCTGIEIKTVDLPGKNRWYYAVGKSYGPTGVKTWVDRYEYKPETNTTHLRRSDAFQPTDSRIPIPLPGLP